VLGYVLIYLIVPG
jgi:hypothetical protein